MGFFLVNQVHLQLVLIPTNLEAKKYKRVSLMIGCLKGDLIESSDNKILILTESGIGYEVFYSGETRLSKNDNSSFLVFTTNIIKETSNELYGFASIEEKKIFELLISVKGAAQSRHFRWFQQSPSRHCSGNPNGQ